VYKRTFWGPLALILYFDLAGFTRMSGALGPDIIEMLNGYFGAVVPAIEARGGNVLKFMGDGILAIFAKDTVPDTEMAAVDCLLDLTGEMSRVSAERTAANLPVTTATMALHAGEVFYGNIGSANRLDFTVIGPAVNTAARIEAMTKAVDQSIVIGARVARPLLQRRTDLVSLGQYLCAASLTGRSCLRWIEQRPAFQRGKRALENAAGLGGPRFSVA